jgi:NAD(P)-dependent dehydrogenase (short-subunit alcohol dehydrogenase family)
MSKIWLITGSARGLGRSIAQAALAAGDSVVATARDPVRMANLQERHSDNLRTFALDVTDASAAQAAVEFAVGVFGRLDVLVNNAGFGCVVPFEQTEDAEFRAQIDTNFYGVVNLVRAAVPVMRDQRSGHIINISSVGGRTGTPGLSAYQAAKWAVGGFTEVLAQEVAPFGVKVISVEGEMMRTHRDFTAGGSAPALLPDYEPSVGVVLGMLKRYVGNEIDDPEKVAKVVLDLVGSDTLPAHLVLGSDALRVFGQAEAARQPEATEWAPVSTSNDFEGVDLSFLAGARLISNEPTLDQLLAEPIVRQLMRRDRIDEGTIRHLMQKTGAARPAVRAENDLDADAPPSMVRLPHETARLWCGRYDREVSAQLRGMTRAQDGKPTAYRRMEVG